MQIPEIPVQRKFVSANASRVPRPLYRPQTGQNCGSYIFYAWITEMYCYLSIDLKKAWLVQKKFAAPTLTSITLKSHSNAHYAYSVYRHITT